MELIFKDINIGDEVIDLLKPPITKVQLVRYAGASGDFNPLHIYPEFALRSGRFKDVILHGLCTYGIAARAILYGACEGEVSRFKEFNARFSSPVYLGDTITTEGWKLNNRYIIQARTEQAVVISNGYAVVE